MKSMLKSFECPICKHDHWQPIEKYSYSTEDGKNHSYTKWSSLRRKINIVGRAMFVAKPSKHIAIYRHLNAFQQLRRDVLFNVWFPKKDEVNLTSVFCETCGFVCYTPRPEEKDISNKYRYLKQFYPDLDGQTPHDSYTRKLDMKRAERIFNQCTRYLANKKLEILDYGGANGKIMIPFVGKNHNCSLIDYNDHTIDGVSKLADDINSCKIGQKFDLIICSHVLEHVSDIYSLISKLKELLKPGGIIYAEVPQEIWSGLRMDADPVTHINFFTLNSFKNLFLINGFKILEANQQISNYGRANVEVVWLIVQSDSYGANQLLPPDTKALLFPSRVYSVKKIYKLLVTLIIRKIKYGFF